mmetsp:Transcript_144255/g.462000  ORF Transcript_144255/g.462000 Transcript_144255/m.462000 type:complete len:954 (-) Transcript_144255:63-2924(-)
MNFQGSKEQLRAQIQTFLADPAIFDFQCECAFRGLDTQSRGALTLPDVAPMIRSIAGSSGKVASAQAELDVWSRHCDKEMHHMTVAQFKSFVRALFQESLESCRASPAPVPAHGVGAAFQPLAPAPAAAPAAAAAFQPFAPPLPSRKVDPSPSPSPIAPSPKHAPPEEIGAPARRGRSGAESSAPRPQVEETGQERVRSRGPSTAKVGAAAPPAVQAAPVELGASSAREPRGRPGAPGGGPAAMVVTQDAARSPPPPTARRPPSRELSASKRSGLGAAPTGALPERGAGAGAGDALDETFRQLSATAKEAIQSARSPYALGLGNDHFDGRTTVLTSLEAALQRAHELVAKLKVGELFEDPEFGPTAADPQGARSINRGDAMPEDAPELPSEAEVCWLRPSEISSSATFAGELRGVRPGAFGNGWFVGALGTLALRESLLFGDDSGYRDWEQVGVYPRLFWDPELRSRGLYCLRFHKYGQWLYVIVDDRLPCARGSKAPLGAQAVGASDLTFQLWAPLIEKAYAKLHGAYSSLWSGFIDDALRDLTSWPTEKLPSAKYAAWRGPTTPVGKPSAGKDPAELWTNLDAELRAGALLASSRVGDGLGDGGGEDQLVHVEAAAIGLEDSMGPGMTCTGLRRNTAYAVVALREAEPSVRFVRLRDAVSGLAPNSEEGWRGRWSSSDPAWLASARIAAALSAPTGSSSSTAPPRLLPPIGARADGGGGTGPGPCDGTFWMLFEDWLQVFSHVFVSRPLTEGRGWASLHLPGRWTSESCGGTPINVKDAPPRGSPESWGKNPQCRLVFEPSAEAATAASSEEASRVEVCVALQQPDARMSPGSPFPFQDRLLELFLCISQLDSPDQRLPVFNKKRIVKGGVTLISKRREVLLRTWLPVPGAYAIVPSTWEVDLGGRSSEAPFLLSLHLRCAPGRYRLEAPAAEGWDALIRQPAADGAEGTS